MVSPEELCEKIFAVDGRIFLVGVFEQEHLVCGGPRKGRSGLIAAEEKLPVLRFQLHLVKTMLKDWGQYFGDFEIVTLRFRKAVLCALPWKNKWVHVVGEPSLNATIIRQKVQPLLR